MMTKRNEPLNYFYNSFKYNFDNHNYYHEIRKSLLNSVYSKSQITIKKNELQMSSAKLRK